MLMPRIITAVTLAGLIVLALFFASTTQLVGFVTAVMLLGAWEWAGFIPVSSGSIRVAYVLLIGVILGILYWLPEAALGFPWILWTAIAWWILAFLWLVMRPTLVPIWSVLLGGVAVLVPAWVALSVMQIQTDVGPEWLFFLLLLIASADVGAYFSGRALGKNKLAPKVSPGKTWEGFVGGILLSGVVALAGAHWFSVNWLPFIGLCFAVVMFSVVGDLTESLFKRNAGLKDSGRLLPGHGGILDRIDSLTAAAPAFVLGLFALGELA